MWLTPKRLPRLRSLRQSRDRCPGRLLLRLRLHQLPQLDRLRRPLLLFRPDQLRHHLLLQ
jgi:hypothetical protein